MSAVAFRAEPSSSYRWSVVALLWWVCFFNYADRQAIYSVFPLLARDLRLSTVQLAMVGSAFMWMYALAGPIAGWLCDLLRRKWIILGALLFWSAVTAATGLVHQYSALVLVRALSGLGEAFYFPAALSLIGDYHQAATRSRAMSLHQSSVYVGTVAGGGLAAWVAEHSGWQQSFLVFGVSGIVLAFVLALSLREPERTASARYTRASLARELLSILRNGPALALVGIFVGANFVASAFLIWLPTYLFDRMHLSIASAGLQATLSVQGGSVIGVLLGGFVADRFASHAPGGRMRAQAIGLLLGFPFVLVTGLVPELSLLIPVLLGFGLCKGIYDANIWASLYDTIEPEQRGFAAGLMNSIGWIGGGLAPIYIALASRRFGMGGAISSTALLYLLLGAGMLLVSHRFSQAQAVPR